MKLSTYNPSLPHACDEESFNVGYKYGLVNRWKEGVFRVGDFTVFPEGVFTDDGLVLLSQALSQGWNHRNFFYYQRLGVNWFTGPAIDSFIDFIKPKQVSDQVIPERPVRPDNPADVLKKSQVLHGSGATPIESPERLSSIWDVGSSILSILDRIHLEDGSNLTPDIRFAPPGFVLNGSRLSSDISTLGKSGGMTALPLIQCLKQMGNTGFSRKLVDPLLTNAVIENFGKLAAEHGLFIALWFDEYQWPAIARSIDRNMLLRPDFDELCYEAYQYSPGDDVKKRFDLLREHSFWNLVLKSLESQVITQATSDWIDEYHSNRICIICGREFNLFRQKGWIYFGSNGAKNICFNCPIVEYPGTHDIDGRVRDFVQSCGFPPPDGYTPIDIRVTSVMDEKTTVEMIKAWSAMGGIDHVKQTYGVSWFESMVHSGSLPDGTIVTSRGIKSLADDGCVCLSVAERLIDDWLNSNGVAHVREPLYPVHAEYNANGLRRADWLVGDTYVEYFGLHGNQDYDVKTTAKLALAKAEGINILPIYPTDMINMDEVLKDLVDMPKEQENPIERRDPGANIGRRSNIARRSMDAANYVRRLGSRYETDLQQTSTYTEYTYEFWLKWGTHGTDDGEFLSLGGVAVAPDGSVYVADHDHHRIQKFTSAGVFLTKWDTEGDGKLVYPHSVAVAPDGSVYVLEGRVFSPRVKKFTSAGVFLTEWGARGDGDGEFKSADSVTVAPSGNVYVSEFDNHRVQKFTSEGTFLTKWGTEGTGDGQFITPKGVAVAPDGSVYVADNGNRRVQKFTSEGAFLTKWGTEGTGDGQFISLMGIVAAPGGSVYVAEADTRPKQIEKSNGTSSWVTTKVSDNQRIQEFTSDGVFLAKWGMEGEGDGQFRWPWYVAAATDGSIYVADRNNHRIQVFKRVSPN